ncbi:MAG: hypothetical protein Q9208_005408 [Pyrenodesmia sp. 3 TL-2023]
MATPAAIDENSNIVHDTLIQDLHKAAFTEQQAGQQDPTSPEMNNVVPPSSEKAKIGSNKLGRRFFLSHDKFPNDQSPIAVPASSMLSPPPSQDAEGSSTLPVSASTTPSKDPATTPPVTSVDGTDERPAKRARVMDWNQASFGPASRTKRRRIADQELAKDVPEDCGPKRQDRASSSACHNPHTPPPEISKDEGASSVESTTQPEEMPWEDFKVEADQAKGPTLTHINTPQSMVERDGFRPPLTASTVSPSATFPTSAASPGRETSVEKETVLAMGESRMSATSGNKVEGNADDDDGVVVEEMIHWEGHEVAQVDHRGHPTNDVSRANPSAQLTAQDRQPESTVGRAIFSLQPHQRLTTTCIELLLRMFNTGDMRIFDPAYIDCENPQPKPALGIPPNQTLLIPLHHRGGDGHWTLAVVVNNTTAYFYNSWTSLKYTQQAWRAMDVFCRSQSSVPELHPKLELRACRCPQQTNADDCGIFVLVAALYIMAQQPMPDTIDSQSWRPVFQAALDVSRPLSDIEASLRVEREEESVSLHGDTNLSNLAAHLLRRRVERVQKTFKTLESQLTNARKTCTIIEILESNRKDVHNGLLVEQNKWAVECARLEGVRQAVSALEYCKTNVRGSLDQTMADAHRARVAASGEVTLSTVHRFAIGRATRLAKSLSVRYSDRLATVVEQREALLAELRAADQNERQAREERQRWIEGLEKECVVPGG